MNDKILGRVVEELRQLGWGGSTDIIITPDHNHSTVSGDVAYYPLRAIVDRGIGAPDPHGYSVSGFVRTAELLTRDGLKAYDGAGCRDIPNLSTGPRRARRSRQRLVWVDFCQARQSDIRFKAGPGRNRNSCFGVPKVNEQTLPNWP